MPEACGAEPLWVGGGGEAGGGEAERNRGQAGTAARLAGGRCGGGLEPIGEPECGLARELQGRRVLVTSRVMLPRVFPEGTSAEGGTRLREAPGSGCSITPRTSHGPKASSSRDSPPGELPSGAERDDRSLTFGGSC